MSAPPPTAAFRRCFMAYGVRIGLWTTDPAVRDDIDRLGVRTPLPPGWIPIEEPSHEGAAWYAIRATESLDATPLYRLALDGEPVADRVDATDLLRQFVVHAEFRVAERAPDHLFVHAGVVAWDGRAVLLPGRSGAGKTSLVSACLTAGATYYSDEYAVLDRAGRVQPYDRPLAIRGAPGEPVRHVPAETLGAAIGRETIPAGLIVLTEYRPRARWRPTRLTAAQALLALMRHTVAARGSPAHSMPILSRTVTSARAFAGKRSEATALATHICERLHKSISGWAE